MGNRHAARVRVKFGGANRSQCRRGTPAVCLLLGLRAGRSPVTDNTPVGIAEGLPHCANRLEHLAAFLADVFDALMALQTAVTMILRTNPR